MDETLYDQLGTDFFVRLVDAFYAGVKADPVLRDMYPEDLAESKRHLALFLIQYWGGPRTYGAERGHPRLRLRHAPFVVDETARDAWLAAMRGAIASVGNDLTLEQEQQLNEYFEMAAASLLNS